MIAEYEEESNDRLKRGTKESSSMATDCSFDTLKENTYKPGAGQYCKVNIKESLQGECTKKNKFGYPKGSPCILLKLNKVNEKFNQLIRRQIKTLYISVADCNFIHHIFLIY